VLGRQTFDAVLMDLQMPVLDGYETTRQLRLEPAYANLPILAMTAHAMVQERDRCEALGMNDYITKPIDPTLLASTLAKWVGATEAGAAQAGTDLSALLNLEAGLDCFAGDEELLEWAMHKFLDLNLPKFSELRTALDQGAWPRVELVAHGMISMAGTIGALELAATARAIQDATHAGALDVLPPLVDTYEQHLAATLEGLGAHFRTT